jgi:menaquinol-cytochrome c reductase iron-sulfur subunit
MCENKNVSRRKIMKWVVAGIGASTGGILGVPAVTSILSPMIRHTSRAATWRPVGEVNQFPLGQIVAKKIETRLEREFLTKPKDVYVWRKSESDFVIYSRSCTDLGCPVKFDPGSECFFCPCHGGIFSKEGERMAGPPKSPLYRYQFRIQDGFLEVDLSSVPLVA